MKEEIKVWLKVSSSINNTTYEQDKKGSTDIKQEEGNDHRKNQLI